MKTQSLKSRFPKENLLQIPEEYPPLKFNVDTQTCQI